MFGNSQKREGLSAQTVLCSLRAGRDDISLSHVTKGSLEISVTAQLTHTQILFVPFWTATYTLE